MVGNRGRKRKAEDSSSHPNNEGKGKDQILDVTNIPAPANADVTKGTRISNGVQDFSTKEGTFIACKYLAAPEASSSLKNNTAPTLPDDEDDDEKLYQVCSTKKCKFSNGKHWSPSLPVPKKVSRKAEIVAQNAITSNNETVWEPNKNSSCSILLKIVLSIDHVRELIFSRLDNKTLAECRHISIDWAYFAAKAVQKRMITPLHVNRRGFEKSFRSHDNSPNNKNLISLMNNSTAWPTAHFSLVCYEKLYHLSYAQPLLNAIGGSCIKILKFRGKVSLNELKLLICTQTPNLEQLSLSDFSCHQLMTDDMDYKPPEENCVKTRSSRLDDEASVSPTQSKLLQNLKFFRCEDHIPVAFVQNILELSPNLAKVRLPRAYRSLLVLPKKLKFYNVGILDGAE